MLVESLEGRRLMCANTGEFISGNAHVGPGNQAAVVHSFQAAVGSDFGREVVAPAAVNPESLPC